ncbi:MAG: hypothetical protein U0441_30020 [Polyangiaceae bacterium]
MIDDLTGSGLTNDILLAGVVLLYFLRFRALIAMTLTISIVATDMKASPSSSSAI